MTRKQTHDAVCYMGKKAGKNIWKQIGKVIHDDEKNKDILWLDPHAVRGVLNQLGNTGNDIPILLAPKTGQALTTPNEPEPTNPELGHGPLCGCPTCKERREAIATPHKYTEPPMDFDDDIPFN